MPKSYLSKSKLLSFLQCPRRLWLEINQPELRKDSAQAQSRMAAGTAVGVVAQSLHPEGVLIESQDNLSEALRLTQELIHVSPRRPLFEATFSHDGVLVRTDLLLPEGDSWRLVEVKSSTEVKDYHYQDAAIQAHVMAGHGLPLSRVAIQFINNRFVYPGGGCYHQVTGDGQVNSLFSQEDVTEAIAPLMKEHVPIWIAEARKTMTGDDMPATTDNCAKPYECPFLGFCHSGGPEYPVARLPRIRGNKVAQLQADGYEDIRDIPDDVLANETHEWVRQVTLAGKPDLRPGAAEALARLGYPRYYLDFETIQFAVPIWKGTRPYQQLPFQWSCHIEDTPGQLRHEEFLDLSGENPGRAHAEKMVACLGNEGPVMVYNKGFEGRVLRELAAAYADHAPALLAIEERLVDLLPLTRQNYYHPAMLGRWSLKAVLPTIAPDLDYSELEGVQEGSQAQEAFLEAIARGTTEDRKQQLEKALLAYCQRDTEAMVHLAWFLEACRRN